MNERPMQRGWWNMAALSPTHAGVCVGRVNFMLFVLFSFALGSQHKRCFWWPHTNMLVSKNPLGPKANPNQPNAGPSWWNIVRIGHVCVGFAFRQFSVVCLILICIAWPT